MTKKDPSYETGWHSTGTMEVLPSIDQVADRVDANKHVVLHAVNLDTEKSSGWWSYDAVWITDDGARVRGRLNLHNVKPGDPTARKKSDLAPHDYDPAVKPLSGYFHAYAEADRPWNPDWPSPLAVFLDRKSKPSYAMVEYTGCNLLHPGQSHSLADLIGALAKLPWVATVFTHDDLDPEVMFQPGAVGYQMPLISRLPASLYGRTIDMRVMGEPARRNINRTLSKYGTQLPRGGAAIVLDTERRKGLQAAELSFPMSPSLTAGGDISDLSAVLAKLMTEQALRNDSDAVEELRTDWKLLTDVERAREEAALMDDAASRIEELRNDNDRLRALLGVSQEFVERFKASGEDLVEECKATRERERKALEEQKKLRTELDRLLRMVRDSDLGKAMAAKEAAEEETELAEELLDEQQHEVLALRQEVANLRREVARLGSTFELPPVVPQETGPETWEEFFTRAASLEFVRLGPVQDGIDKLRGQTQERRWIHRSWEALRALEEYARLKKERGVETMPHFTAYLLDPLAEHAIPRTRYTSAESKGVMMNSRFVAARTLPVSRKVSPSGRTVMEAHIRIGSGKPPAPRMHFHDDTSGETGKIYIGHLGPHLPNYQTN